MKSQKPLAEILHDISTPATVIAMNADLLKAHFAQRVPDADTKKYFQRLAQASEKLNQIIKEAQKAE